MIKLHYTISHAIDDCLNELEENDLNPLKQNRKKLRQKLAERQQRLRERGYSLNSSVFPKKNERRDPEEGNGHSCQTSLATSETMFLHEDELEDHLDVGFNPPRRVIIQKNKQ
jgi:hypothetical protein